MLFNHSNAPPSTPYLIPPRLHQIKSNIGSGYADPELFSVAVPAILSVVRGDERELVDLRPLSPGGLGLLVRAAADLCWEDLHRPATAAWWQPLQQRACCGDTRLGSGGMGLDELGNTAWGLVMSRGAALGWTDLGMGGWADWEQLQPFFDRLWDRVAEEYTGVAHEDTDRESGGTGRRDRFCAIVSGLPPVLVLVWPYLSGFCWPQRISNHAMLCAPCARVRARVCVYSVFLDNVPSCVFSGDWHAYTTIDTTGETTTTGNAAAISTLAASEPCMPPLPGHVPGIATQSGVCHSERRPPDPRTRSTHTVLSCRASLHIHGQPSQCR